MDKKIKCDLCEKTILYKNKIRMTNKINKNIIDICKECYDEFFNKPDSEK
ncbi:ribosome-binding protein aMBF1 (putative translation factor) [Clostridium beijerinckii]|nr:mszf55-1 [Clostridium beijerinckii]NOW85556.1 ribosome-binding protein aMBF1 (putative translation factor) [Clostridium beijerinckii]